MSDADDETTSELTIETTVPTDVLPDAQARNYARVMVSNDDGTKPGTIQLAMKVLELLDRIARIESLANGLDGSDETYSGDAIAARIRLLARPM